MSTFTRLPMELKELIMEEIYLSDISILSEGFHVQSPFKKARFTPLDFKNGVAPKGSTLNTVALVNREMYKLSKPILCKVLDLYCLASNSVGITEELLSYIERHKQHIKILICPVITFQDNWLGSDRAVLKITNLEHKWVQSLNHTLRQMINTINLQTIELHPSFLAPLYDSSLPIIHHPLTCETLDIISRFKNITSLYIKTDAPIKVPEDMVLHVIRNMESLALISLQNIASQSSELAIIQSSLQPSDDEIQITKEFSFPLLSSLEISGFSQEEDILTIFKKSPLLKTGIFNSPNIRVSTVTKLIKGWSNLSFLDVNVRGGGGSIDLILYCSRKGIQLDEAFY
ncbi:hypothetical protein CROQUDRAFT_676496 [Cronartium quercuum f. sp. fusiforme G11]|uniref:Uncharacterized protein n=1 Tax=Cronartium quercuum f. sp. fusiforme G11 TaxID=708437 RepID=A0A9P6NUQ8_9BASI|nr:hypothetical protein CROQUDRAFT_676496 [Cronartium quercuum f. sp. fusiforme G11]